MGDAGSRFGQGALRWWIVLVLVLLGALGGMLYTLLAAPSFTAQAFVVVTADPVTGDRRDVSFAQAFGRVVGQQDVASLAAATAGVHPDEVIRSVQARTSPDAPIIEITGSSAAAQKSADLVNAVANGLVTFAGGRQKDTGVRLSVLSAATPPGAPSSPSLVLDLAVGTATGVLLGALFLLARGGVRQQGRAAARPDAEPERSPEPPPPTPQAASTPQPPRPPDDPTVQHRTWRPQQRLPPHSVRPGFRPTPTPPVRPPQPTPAPGFPAAVPPAPPPPPPPSPAPRPSPGHPGGGQA